MHPYKFQSKFSHRQPQQTTALDYNCESSQLQPFKILIQCVWLHLCMTKV